MATILSRRGGNDTSPNPVRPTLMSNHEDLFVEKDSGEVLGPYKALFAGNTILIFDEYADIENGDTVFRKLPNGKDERSSVAEAKFYRAGLSGNNAGHFQVKTKVPGGASSRPSAQHINISNAQSVQIGDHNAQTIINSFETLVDRINSSNASVDDKRSAKKLMDDFLKHPIVVSVLGSTVKGLLS